MKPLSQEAFTILAFTLLLCHVSSESSAKPEKESTETDYYYDDIDDDMIYQNDILNEGKPCPRDCVCSGNPETRIAKCSRLEIGTQVFGNDVKGLEVTNLDRKHPLILTDMIFYKMGLHQLTNMRLTNNIMIMLEPTAFNGLKGLLSANLTNNHITDVDMNIFDSNPNLALVDFSDNPLSVSKYDRPILNSSSIQELEIARCGITTLHKRTFSLLSNVMYINLAGNKLQQIDPMLFANLIALEEVDLSDNSLREIPDNLFAGNPNITTLTLRGNPIKSVVGVEIKELLTIDLSLTSIKTIGPSMFSGMNILSNVNLSGSGISKIHNQAFHNLTFLNYLDLSDNDLDMVSDQLIKENMELDIFKIARNPLLTKLPKNGFACANSTFNIYLFDASGCRIEMLHDNTFKTMSALSQLLLSDNEITFVGKSLHYCPKLIKIDLSNNLITSLDKNTFSRNTELGKLNLAGNPLKTLSPELFIDNPNIAWLDVSYCELTTLWTIGSFKPRAVMNNLHFINASNNEIKTITKKELEIINKLFTLDIAGNPLECNLDFEVLMTWLGEHRVSPGARDMISSDTMLTENIKDKHDKWEALAKSVCRTEPSKPVINDKLIPSENKNKAKTSNKINDFYVVDDDDDYDSDEDYYDNKDDTEDHIYDDNFMENKKNKEKAKEIIENAEKNDKVTEKTPENTNKLGDINSNADELIELVSKINENIATSEIDIPLADDLMKDSSKAEEELVEAYLEQQRYNRNYYIIIMKATAFMVVIIVLILGLIRLGKLCASKERNHVRCAIISVNRPRGDGRVKKDCGLVYQQLSEDLTGPKTPIISRHLLGVHDKNKIDSYQVGHFHHSNITPEHV